MKNRGSLLCFLLALSLIGSSGFWMQTQQRQYALDRQLISALVHNNTRQALALVNAGADPNTRYSPSPAPSFQRLLTPWLHQPSRPNNSDTAIMYACGGDMYPTLDDPMRLESCDEDLPLLQAMLSHGANLHVRGEGQSTLLHCAVKRERLHTVEWLLQHDADVNAQDKGKQTPLILAAWNATPEVARLLLAHGANLNAQDVSNNTALHWAVIGDKNGLIVRELLAHGADPNRKNWDGETPRSLARKNKRTNIGALTDKKTNTIDMKKNIPIH